MDTNSVHDWADLADPLSHDPDQFWFCVLAGSARQSRLVGGAALRNQSGCQSDLHANSIRAEKPAIGGGRYSDRLGFDSVADGRSLASF